jgi:hypothetical protein
LRAGVPFAADHDQHFDLSIHVGENCRARTQRLCTRSTKRIGRCAVQQGNSGIAAEEDKERRAMALRSRHRRNGRGVSA